jgi:CDP-diacylglycerol---glycerol-3-phosphate 3-phosphatidyltransferase
VTGSLVSPELRTRVRSLATPVATALGRLGLSPNALTVIGFVGTCLAGLAAGEQQWTLAGLLVLAFGIFDLFDGTLARATGQVTTFGAFLDSSLDRAGEAIVYIGIAGGAVAGGFEPGAVLAAAAMAAAFLVSYVRAKAESLGYAPGSGLAAVGLAPREVRLAILTIGLLAVGLAGGIGGITCVDLPCVAVVGNPAAIIGVPILGGTLGLITILASTTVIQRILHVRAQAKEG